MTAGAPLGASAPVIVKDLSLMTTLSRIVPETWIVAPSHAFTTAYDKLPHAVAGVLHSPVSVAPSVT